MKKKVLAVVIAAATLTSFSSSAQKKFDGRRAPDSKELRAIGDSCRIGGPACNPFEGLNLTPEQQQKIDKLKKDCKASRDKERAEAREMQKAERDRKKARVKESREKYLKDIKAILTQDQYIQFLENNFVNAPQSRFGKGDLRNFKNRKGDLRRGDAPKGKLRGSDFKKTDK